MGKERGVIRRSGNGHGPAVLLVMLIALALAVVPASRASAAGHWAGAMNDKASVAADASRMGQSKPSGPTALCRRVHADVGCDPCTGYGCDDRDPAEGCD